MCPDSRYSETLHAKVRRRTPDEVNFRIERFVTNPVVATIPVITLSLRMFFVSGGFGDVVRLVDTADVLRW